MQVQAYEGYVENGQFYPTEKPLSITGRFMAVLTVIDAPAQPVKRPRSEIIGLFEGKVWMSDDFNDPIDEMLEYME